jgi:hypothetical protein
MKGILYKEEMLFVTPPSQHILNNLTSILMVPIYFSLLKIRSTGILSKIKSKYEVKSSNTDGVPSYGVRFEVVLPLVGFMTIGVFLSTAYLCVELAVRRFATQAITHDTEDFISRLTTVTSVKA